MLSKIFRAFGILATAAFVIGFNYYLIWWAWEPSFLPSPDRIWNEIWANEQDAIDPEVAELPHCGGYTMEKLESLNAMSPERQIQSLTEELATCDQSADRAILYLGRGSAYVKIEQYQSAIDDLTQVIALDPNLAAGYLGRGMVYAAIGEAQLAIDDLNQAIALDLKTAEVYYFRGGAYRDLGEKQLAIDDYTQAIALDPNYVQAYGSRALVYCLVKPPRISESLADTIKTISLDQQLAIQFQSLLAGAGFYKGVIDGNFDQASQVAWRQMCAAAGAKTEAQ